MIDQFLGEGTAMHDLEAIKELAKEMVASPDTVSRKEIAIRIAAICNKLKLNEENQPARLHRWEQRV